MLVLYKNERNSRDFVVRNSYVFEIICFIITNAMYSIKNNIL